MRIIGFDQISRAGKLCIYSSLLFFPFLFKGRSPWSYVTPTCAFRSGSHQEKSCKRGCRLSVTVVVRAHTAQQRTGDTDLRSGTRTGIGRTVHSSPFRQQERSASAKRRGDYNIRSELQDQQVRRKRHCSHTGEFWKRRERDTNIEMLWMNTYGQHFPSAKKPNKRPRCWEKDHGGFSPETKKNISTWFKKQGHPTRI